MLLIGHRGGRGEDWPAENSLAAIDRARREGADGIEIDVRMCASGEVVVFHDRDLSRMTSDRDRRGVEEVRWDELSKIRLFSGSECIPLLTDVLDYCAEHSLLLNVEIKYDVRDRVTLVRKVVAILKAANSDLLLSSFDPRLLLLARAMGLRTRRAWLTDSTQRYAPALLRAIARRPMFDGVHLEQAQATEQRIDRLKRRDLFVGVWTVNDANVAKRLERAGVDWIITDNVGRMNLETHGS